MIDNDAKYLVEALEMTLSYWMRSTMALDELEKRAQEFETQISPASGVILQDFLASAASANDASFKITHVLVKDIDLSPLFERASSGAQAGALEQTDAIMGWTEYGLLITTSFLSAFALHDVLTQLVEKPEPTMGETAKSYGAAAAKYLMGLGKRTIMADELEEILTLVGDLGDVRHRLATDEFTLTAQKIARFDKSIAIFVKAAATVKELDRLLRAVGHEASQLAERTGPSSA